MNTSLSASSRPRVRGRAWSGLVWVAVYLLLVTFPLIFLLADPVSKGGGFGWDFAQALGFGGLSIMGLQSVLTARFRRATAPFGADILYYFHRWVAVGGFVLIVGHYGLLKLGYPEALGPLDPGEALPHMTAGRVALGLFALLIVSSLGRKALRIEYDRWRISHSLMALVAVVLAIWHVAGVGHYTEVTWKALVWIGYSAAFLVAIVYIRLLRPFSLLRSPYRVREVRPERGRCWTVVVEPLGHAGLKFRPGQFAWLTLRSSPFRAHEHPFSFSGSAEQAGRLQFTIKELGDFTRTVGTLVAGDAAFVDGPHGVFTCDAYPEAPGFVFIAGGVGIAPIMSMLRTLADRNDPRPIQVVYGNRAWEAVLFREEWELLGRRLNLRVVQVLQEPPPDWNGLTGVLDAAVLESALPGDLTGQEVFLCGPVPMIDSAHRFLRSRGLPRRQIHCELFDMA